MLNRRVFITLLGYDVRITAVCVYDAKKKSCLSNIVRTSLEQNYSVLAFPFPPSFLVALFSFFIFSFFHFRLPSGPSCVSLCTRYARRNYQRTNYMLVMRFAYSRNASTTIKRLKERVAGSF